MSVESNFPIPEDYNNTCVCCLRENVPFINLFTCQHAGFLRELFSNKSTYPLNVVCRECHHQLMKFTDFMKQVDISIKLLNRQIHHSSDLLNKPIHNLECAPVKCTSYTDTDSADVENNYKEHDLRKPEERVTKTEIVSDPIELNHEVDIPMEFIKLEYTEVGDDTIKEESDADEDMPLSDISPTKISRRPYTDIVEPSSSIANGAQQATSMEETPLPKPKPYENQVRVIALSKEEYLVERELERAKASFLKLPYRCEECVVGFEYEDTLKEHMQKRHHWVRTNPGPSGVQLKRPNRKKIKLAPKPSETKTRKSISLKKTLPAEVKAFIEELFGKALKPKQIIERVEKQYGDNIDKEKVHNYFITLKRKLGPQSSLSPCISISELDNWINSNDDIPDDMHCAFVINHVMINNDDRDFKFIISTKRLLQNAIECEDLILHTTSTNSLMWYNYPVILVGMTDRRQTFHLLAIAVCSDKKTETFQFIFDSLKTTIKKIFKTDLKPKVLVADTAVEIHDGFAKVFPDCPVRICWIHMNKILQNSLQSLDFRERELIMKDIVYLQAREDKKAFSKCLELFLVKWISRAKKFVDYFTYAWVKKNSSWYEGFCPGTLGTNAALDNATKALKHENAVPEKLGPKRFCSVIKNAVERLSCKYRNDCFQVAQVPVIPSKLWRDALSWTKINKKLLVREREGAGGAQEFVIPRGPFLDAADVSDLCINGVGNFDDYVEARDKFHKVYLPKDKKEWLKGGCCTCESFLHTYLCKHVLAIAVRLGYVEPPEKIYNSEQRRPNEPETVWL